MNAQMPRPESLPHVAELLRAVDVVVNTMQLQKKGELWTPVRVKLTTASDARRKLYPAFRVLQVTHGFTVVKPTENVSDRAMARSLAKTEELALHDPHSGQKPNLSGARAVIFSEIVFSAAPLIEAAHVLFGEGAQLVRAFCFVDFDFAETKKQLALCRVELDSLVTVPNLVKELRAQGRILAEDLDFVAGWHADPRNFLKDK